MILVCHIQSQLGGLNKEESNVFLNLMENVFGFEPDGKR